MKKITLFIFIILIILTTQSLFCQLIERPSNLNEENAGTAENPYLISNLNNLAWLSGTWSIYLDCHFLQTANIDATETITWYNGLGFLGIGYYRVSDYENDYAPFTGYYDGNHYSINNLYQSGNFGYRFGLFYGSYGATIKNVRLENINLQVSGDWMFGGLVAVARNTIIENCSVSGIITTTEAPVSNYSGGGLVGRASDTIIDNSVSYVNITQLSQINRVGGLVGYMNNSTLKNSFFYGNLIFDSEMHNKNSAGLVSDINDSIIENCYITSPTKLVNVSAIFGNITNSTVINCFYDVESTDLTKLYNSVIHPNNIANNFGLTTGEMKRTTIYEGYGWDFETVWAINPNFNNCYPFLRSLNPEIEHVAEKDNVIKPINQTWVYPNPVLGNEVNIKSTSRNNSLEVTIYNIRGQLVNRSNEFFTKDGESVFTWNKRDMNNNEVTSGVYFYKIVDPNDKNSVHHGRFLILK